MTLSALRTLQVLHSPAQDTTPVSAPGSGWKAGLCCAACAIAAAHAGATGRPPAGQPADAAASRPAAAAPAHSAPPTAEPNRPGQAGASGRPGGGGGYNPGSHGTGGGYNPGGGGGSGGGYNPGNSGSRPPHNSGASGGANPGHGSGHNPGSDWNGHTGLGWNPGNAYRNDVIQGWVRLGAAFAGKAADKDIIHAYGRYRYTQVKFCVRGADVAIHDVQVVYERGGQQPLQVRSKVRKGECTTPYYVWSGRYDIRYVYLFFRQADNFLNWRQAEVDLYAR